MFEELAGQLERTGSVVEVGTPEGVLYEIRLKQRYETRAEALEVLYNIAVEHDDSLPKLEGRGLVYGVAETGPFLRVVTDVSEQHGRRRGYVSYGWRRVDVYGPYVPALPVWRLNT